MQFFFNQTLVTIAGTMYIYRIMCKCFGSISILAQRVNQSEAWFPIDLCFQTLMLPKYLHMIRPLVQKNKNKNLNAGLFFSQQTLVTTGTMYIVYIQINKQFFFIFKMQVSFFHIRPYLVTTGTMYIYRKSSHRAEKVEQEKTAL